MISTQGIANPSCVVNVPRSVHGYGIATQDLGYPILKEGDPPSKKLDKKFFYVIIISIACKP